MGSSSHLPPYSSQPDPYPQPSLAQQARCLIPTKRLPAGGCGVGETKAGWSCGSWGAPQRGPFDLVPGPAGQTAQTDSNVSTPCLLLLSLLSATQTPGADGETEEGEEKETERRGGWWANEHNEETDTDYPDHPPSLLHSSLGTDLSIPYGQAAALSSSPLCDPSLVCSLLYPSAATSKRAPGLCLAEHAPTGCI